MSGHDEYSFPGGGGGHSSSSYSNSNSGSGNSNVGSIVSAHLISDPDFMEAMDDVVMSAIASSFRNGGEANTYLEHTFKENFKQELKGELVPLLRTAVTEVVQSELQSIVPQMRSEIQTQFAAFRMAGGGGASGAGGAGGAGGSGAAVHMDDEPQGQGRPRKAKRNGPRALANAAAVGRPPSLTRVALSPPFIARPCRFSLILPYARPSHTGSSACGRGQLRGRRQRR
jgi:hypothetical protein